MLHRSYWSIGAIGAIIFPDSFTNQVSISPIFYEQLFHMKVFCAAFTYLQFGFEIFWRKDFGTKAAHKMLVNLTPEESQ
jgi:hypothetical protein